MNTDKIIVRIGIIGLHIILFCICTIFILVEFNFIEFDESDEWRHYKTNIVEAGEKEKPYKLTDEDKDIMYKAREGGKVTINDKVYIKHYCNNGLSEYIRWFDVENLCFVNSGTLN